MVDRRYKEIRLVVKEPIWQELKERAESSKFVTITELVRHLIYDYLEVKK